MEKGYKNCLSKRSTKLINSELSKIHTNYPNRVKEACNHINFLWIMKEMESIDVILKFLDDVVERKRYVRKNKTKLVDNVGQALQEIDTKTIVKDPAYNFIDHIENSIKKDENVLVSIDSLEGAGKSTIAKQIATIATAQVQGGIKSKYQIIPYWENKNIQKQLSLEVEKYND